VYIYYFFFAPTLLQLECALCPQTGATMAFFLELTPGPTGMNRWVNRSMPNANVRFLDNGDGQITLSECIGMQIGVGWGWKP